MNSWSIQKRFLLIFVVSTLVLGSLLVVFVGYVLNKQLLGIETGDVVDNNNRVAQTYGYFLSTYEKKAIDWSKWDDTYNFVEDLNKDFIATNLVDETLTNLNVDEMLFYNMDQKLVYATASAATFETEPDFPEDVVELFLKHQDIWAVIEKQGKMSGLVRSDDGVLLYTAQQILKSDGSGPPRGVLIFARYLGPWFTDQLSTIAQTTVTIDPENKDYKDNDNVYSHVTLPIHDSGGAGLHLRVQTKRDIWNNGKLVLVTLFWIVFGLTAFYIVLNYLIIYRYILLDLQNFKQEMHEISENLGEGRMKKQGMTADIDDLRENMNSLLDVLDKAKLTAQQKASELESLNQLMVDRELKMVELKKIINDLKKKII